VDVNLTRVDLACARIAGQRGKLRTVVAVKRFRRRADRDSLPSIDSVEEVMTPLPIRRGRTQRQPIAWLPALAIAATFALVLTATAAEARGGRSHGRRIGAAALSNPTSTPAVTTSAPQQAPHAADPPAQPSVSLRNVGVIPTPPPPAAPPPASQIGVPQTQLLPIAPLSISTTNTAVPTALATGGSSGVPLPETPGGGREGLAACMEFWDSGTHMTKAEWKAACERSVNRLQTISGTKKD